MPLEPSLPLQQTGLPRRVFWPSSIPRRDRPSSNRKVITPLKPQRDGWRPTRSWEELTNCRRTMSRWLNERAFSAATTSALALLVLFVLVIIVSLMGYTSWPAIASALAAPETLFAVKLSLATATITTLLAMATAVPVAYAISRHSFPGKSVVDSLLDLPIVVSPVA